MNENRRKALLIVSSTIASCLCLLLPVVYMLVMSISKSPERLEFTVANFSRLLQGESLHFLACLRNSLIVASLSALFCVGIAGMAAYAISRIAFRGHLTAMLVVLALSMFPQISLAGYLFRMMSKLAWINTYQGLILPYVAWLLPLCLWILVSYFLQIPPDLDRAAKVDGCSHSQVLTKVILPVAAPGLFSTGLLAFIFAFNEFMFALTLTLDHHSRTVPISIALFEGLHGELPWGTVMAASVITTAPVLLLTLLFQRYIIQGLTRGAVKG